MIAKEDCPQMGNPLLIYRKFQLWPRIPLSVKAVSYTHLDVYKRQGQSNMEGVGWLTPEDRAFTGRDTVRALYMTDEWGVANHPLHELWKAVDKVHTDVLGPGDPAHIVVRQVGPGLEFALQMERYFGVPQGVLCCAHGGTAMEHWDPALSLIHI